MLLGIGAGPPNERRTLRHRTRCLPYDGWPGAAGRGIVPAKGNKKKDVAGRRDIMCGRGGAMGRSRSRVHSHLLRRSGADPTLDRVGRHAGGRRPAGPEPRGRDPGGACRASIVGAHWPSVDHRAARRRATGVHSWRQLRPGSYDDFTCRAGAENRRPPFWDALSAAGRRCCVLDVPHSAISPGINGLRRWSGARTTAPSASRRRTRRSRRRSWSATAGTSVSGHSDDWRDVDQLIAFRDDLVRGAMMKGDLSRDFYRKEPWDFFAQVFTEAHCAGHLLWHWHDRSRPWPHGERPAEGDGLCATSTARSIGRSASCSSVVDDDATVIFLANHGMTGKGHANHLLGKVLLKLWAMPRRPSAARFRPRRAGG